MKRTNLSALILILLLCAVSQGAFKFVAWADNRPYDSANEARFIWMLQQMNIIVGSEPLFHVVPGDYDYTSITDADIAAVSLIKTWYSAPGNHDSGGSNSSVDLPIGNPQARFIFLDQYSCPDGVSGCDCSAGRVCSHATAWIDSECASANPVFPIFVVGHEPAFPENRHVGDSLDQYPEDRDAFWSCLELYDATYICGHTHFYSTYSSGGATQIDLGNAGNPGESNQTFVVFEVDGSSVSSTTYTTEYSVDTYPPATNPQPADGATGLSTTPDLTWTAGSGAESHNVYFGPLGNLPTTPNKNVTDSSCKVKELPGYTNGLAYETQYVWRVDEVYDAEHITQGPLWTFTTKEELAVRYAVGETTIKGSVSGDIDGTERREDVYEQISEVLSNQGKKGYGVLEHIWRIDNVPTGLNVQLRIEAHRSTLDLSDSFELSYSTNGSSYDPLGFDVVREYDDNSEDIITLPAGTNNTIWVKVQNTDHAEGSKACDTLYVDCMYIVSSDGTIPAEVVPPETEPGNQSPIANAGPDKTAIDTDGNGQESVTIDGSASSDSDGTIVLYEWAVNGSPVTGTGDSLTYTFAVGTYTVTLTVTDNEGASSEDDAIVQVVAAGGTMHVSNIVGDKTIKGGSGQWTAFAIVTVFDDSDPSQPVFGATVNGQWTGDASGTSSGVTGSDGKVTLSSGNIKRGTTATFTVTGIEHDTMIYTPPVPKDQITIDKL